MNVVQIEEAPNTIGIADSEIYLQGTLEQINARLDLMQSLGVTNVRIMVPWAGVQPLHPDTPFGLGAPRWEQLDRVVNAAAARGMGILGVLNSTPMWATSTTPINGQPTDIDQFAAFAKSVALRYGDKISAYEVWNEPNSVQFLNPLDPAAYTEMLKVTYTALKEASVQTGSEITVIGGVVGAGLTWGDITMNPVDFVQTMYDAGADGYFDALSFHPYNYDWKFSVGDSLPWREGMPLYQVDRIRELMDSYQDVGEEQVKIWITEYGVPTNKVSEATQAAFIRDLIEFWQTAEGAGPIFIYTIQDRLDPTGTDDEAHLGIFRPDGTMKPAAEVLKELIEYYSGPTNPDPDPVTVQSNPIAALLMALQQAVTGLFNLLPNMFSAVSVMITNFIKGIFGGGTAQSPSATVLRTAAADAGIDGNVTETVAASDGDATSTGLQTVSPKRTVAAEDAVTARVATEVGAEEGVVEQTTEPAELTTETTTVPTPEVTATVPTPELTVTEPEAVETPTTQAEPAASTGNDKVTDTVNDNPDTELSDTTLSDAEPATRESNTPNLKARVERGPKTPSGPRNEAPATAETGDRSPSAEGQNSLSAAASGGAS